MKSLKNLDSLSTLVFAIAAFLVLSISFTSCDTRMDEILAEGGNDTITIREGFKIVEDWTPEKKENIINTIIDLDGYCVVNGEISKNRSSHDQVKVRAEVRFNSNFILFSEDGKLPALRVGKGANREEGDHVINTDTCFLGGFKVESEYNRGWGDLYDCSGKDTSVLVGYNPNTTFIASIGAFEKDTTIEKTIYSLYFANVATSTASSYKKEYNANFDCGFRVAVPKGIVPEDVISYILRNVRPTGKATFNTIPVSYDRVKLINGNEVEITEVPGSINWSINATDTTVIVPNWTVNSLAAVRNGFVYTTKTNVASRNFVVSTESKTVVDPIANQEIVLSVDNSIFSFTDKGISALTDLSMEGNYERKMYTSTIEVSVLSFSTSKASNVTLKKEKAEDVITYILRNVRPTGNATINSIPVSYDRVKLVNDKEVETVVVPGSINWGINATDTTVTVTNWNVNSLAAVRNGLVYTTKTNVANRNFVVWTESKTVTDPVANQKVTLSVSSSIFNFSDNGISALSDLANEGNYERKMYTSTIGVNVLSFNASKSSNVTMRKAIENNDDNDDQTMKYAGLSIFFDNTKETNHHVSAVMIYNASKAGSQGGIRGSHDGKLLSTKWDWSQVLKPEELPAGCKYSIILIGGNPTPAYMEGNSSSLIWKSALRSNAGTKIYSITRAKATDKGFFNGDLALTEGVNLVNNEYVMNGHYSKTTDNKTKDYDLSASFPSAW